MTSTIDLDQAIRTLEDLRRNDPVIQRGRNAELTTAFKVFWNSNPDEATFLKHTGGLLFTPAILYHMATHPIKIPAEPAAPLPKESEPDATTKASEGTPAKAPEVKKNAGRK